MRCAPEKPVLWWKDRGEGSRTIENPSGSPHSISDVHIHTPNNFSRGSAEAGLSLTSNLRKPSEAVSSCGNPSSTCRESWVFVGSSPSSPCLVGANGVTLSRQGHGSRAHQRAQASPLPAATGSVIWGVVEPITSVLLHPPPQCQQGSGGSGMLTACHPPSARLNQVV